MNLAVDTDQDDLFARVRVALTFVFQMIEQCNDSFARMLNAHGTFVVHGSDVCPCPRACFSVRVNDGLWTDERAFGGDVLAFLGEQIRQS